MKISVAMTAYNGEKYIKKQLESLENQTKKPDEIIIVDDASGDHTKEIIHDFIENSSIHIILIEHDRNQGYIASFYDALVESTGDIIFLCDQDDIWCGDKIETMSKIIESREVLSLNSMYYTIDENDNVTGERHRGLIPNRIIKISESSVLRYNVAMGCTLATTKEIINLIKKYHSTISRINVPHDLVINLLSASRDRLYLYNRKTIKYRIHKNNTIGFRRANSIEDRITAYKHLQNEKKDIYSMCICLNECEKKLPYLYSIIESYTIKIQALQSKSIIRYIKDILTNRLLRYHKLSSVLYDLRLLMKQNNIRLKISAGGANDKT